MCVVSVSVWGGVGSRSASPQAEEAARQREAEEERRLEEEKLRRLQAIAGEHQRWLQAKAEREAQELAAAEAERPG